MRRNYLYRALLFALLSAVFSGPVRAEKSYELENAAIEAQLFPDGGMQVCESRTYRFNGSFSHAYRTLPLREGVRYSGFQIREGDLTYRQDDSRQPGTFLVERGNNELIVRWHHNAAEEMRTFELTYRVDGAIARYRDAAVLYYQYIGSDWDRPHKQVNLRVRPPFSLNADDVRPWWHAPSWTHLSTEPDGSVLATCQELPAHTVLELRALYPSETFRGLPLIDRDIRQAVIAEEAARGKSLNIKCEKLMHFVEQVRTRYQLGRPIALGVGFAGLLVWIGIFLKCRKPRHPQPPIFPSADIPSDVPPAWVVYLIRRRKVDSSSFITTILDLARRGYLCIIEEIICKKQLFRGTREKNVTALIVDREFWRNNADRLHSFEADVLGFLFDDLAQDGQRIDLDRMQSKRGRMVAFFKSWKKRVAKSAKKQNYHEAASQRGSIYGGLLGFILTLVGCVLAPFFSPWWFVVAALGFVLLIGSSFIVQRTPEGERLVRHYKGLYRYLKNSQFLAAEHDIVLANIDHYLIYGVIFGLGKRFFENLSGLIPDERFADYVPWYHSHSGIFSPASFAIAIRSMVITMSSCSGYGGGSISGEGGGGGDGGAGGAGGGGGGAG